MDLDADPQTLRWAADRLAGLAGDLLAAAHRLPGADGGGRSPADRRCADLVDGLRVDAAELLECARRLYEDGTALVAAESATVDALTVLHRAG